MVALNFKPEFADDVEGGYKRRSIRAPRKDGRDPKPGDKLQLYTGMRTKACRKLGDAKCTRVRQVEIDHMGIKIEGRPLYAGDAVLILEELPHVLELPFKGLLIEWN